VISALFTLYCFFRILPLISAFLTAVLLTPRDLPASVKVANSKLSFVFIFIIITFTPIKSAAAKDNLARVTSESLIPLRFKAILFLSSSVSILPVAAKDRFFLVSSLASRNANFSSVAFPCLNPNKEPAFFSILYSGFNSSK